MLSLKKAGVKSGYLNKNPVLNYVFNKFFETILNYVELTEPESILDVGCGEGLVMKKIREKYDDINITGLDISKENLDISKILNPDAKLVLGDIYSLPFENNSFDLVICTEVLEHLKGPNKGLKEIRRVSKSNSVISVPNEPFFRIGNIMKFSYLKELGNTPGHLQNWSKNEFENLIKNHFSEISINSRLIVWNFALCKK